MSKLRTEWNPEYQVNMTTRERMRAAMGNSVLHSTCDIKETTRRKYWEFSFKQKLYKAARDYLHFLELILEGFVRT